MKMKRRRILYWRAALRPGLESIFKDYQEQLGTELDANVLFLLVVLDLDAWKCSNMMDRSGSPQSVLMMTNAFQQELAWGVGMKINIDAAMVIANVCHHILEKFGLHASKDAVIMRNFLDQEQECIIYLDRRETSKV